MALSEEKVDATITSAWPGAISRPSTWLAPTPPKSSLPSMQPPTSSGSKGAGKTCANFGGPVVPSARIDPGAEELPRELGRQGGGQHNVLTIVDDVARTVPLRRHGQGLITLVRQGQLIVHLRDTLEVIQIWNRRAESAPAPAQRRRRAWISAELI